VKKDQTLLRWRISLIDPDRLLNWLCPRLAFLWSPGFVLLSLMAIVSAGCVAWVNRQELVSSFTQALRWETLLIVWVTLLLATALHELAHGLTCKHYGGEVHEIGFLLLFLMPSLYCNVSDSWLFPRRGQRLLVAMAGGWSDLLLWSLAVFIWRVTEQSTLVNYLAWVVLSVVGTRVFLNLNPLIKLDGYYFLSDLAGVPNLQQKAMKHLMAQLRWLLWGAGRPEPQPNGRFLLLYGLSSWLFVLILISLTTLAIARFLTDRLGPVATVAVVAVSALVLRGLFAGLFEGEVWLMVLQRHRRALTWGLVACAGIGYVALGTRDYHAKGGFYLRAVGREDVRAPTAGILREVTVAEGAVVRPGDVVARLHLPNLPTRQAQTRAEITECEARLRLLLAGVRPEEITAYEERVVRAAHWRDLARADQERARRAQAEELDQFNQQLAQLRAEREHVQGVYQRQLRLRAAGAVAEEHYRDALKHLHISQAQLKQVEAQVRGRPAIGLRDVEAELERRERELAEAQSALALVRLGARSEEIEAEQARLTRFQAEARFLAELETRLVVRATHAGIVTTPRLADRQGQLVPEGEVLCQIEAPGELEAEVPLPDQEADRVRPGQRVELKLRNTPRLTLHGTVTRIAPRAARADQLGPATVTVYCQLTDFPADLRSGAIGHARILCGRRPVREILLDYALAFLRAELWW
jgi:multidrug resistance efflux pump